MMMYFWSMDQGRTVAAQMMSINENLVCKVFRSLEDVCSLDIARNPFIPFGGAAVVKCDESKFNHKAKVSQKLLFLLHAYLFWMVCFPCGQNGLTNR